MQVSANKDLETEVTTLTLQPESKRDEALLAKLLNGYQVAGWGRNATSNALTHVEIKLEPKG
jgi:hypothetical protein